MNNATGYLALGTPSTASLQGSAAKLGATFVLACLINGSPVTTAGTSPESRQLGSHPYSWTNSGLGALTDAGRVIDEQAARAQLAAIAELRRLSGITWDQFARLFGVSRRAAHFWASGKPMTAENEEHLHRMIACLRAADRGSALANRHVLLSSSAEGRIPFDCLVARDYAEAIKLLGRSGEKGQSQLSRGATRVTPDRLPPPPSVLLGAVQEPIHSGYGRAQPVRRRRG